MAIRILLIDDSLETLQTLCLLYTTHPDFEVVGMLTNSRDAFTFLEEQPVDAISIDIQLGHESGIDVCGQIRKRYKDVFIVMCSVFDDMASIVEPAEAVLFLTKPLNQKDLDRFSERVRSHQSGDAPYEEGLPLSHWLDRLIKP